MRIFLFSALVLISSTALAQNPLQPFDSLIGREWWLGEDSYQTFEWGVGGLAVRATAYSVSNGEHTKVSEGEWFYHPGEQKIKGFFTAENMPITFFDYETSFDDDGNMINSIVGFGPMGNGLNFYETWVFTSETEFTWTLSSVGDDGNLTEMMKGNYSRKTR